MTLVIVGGVMTANADDWVVVGPSDVVNGSNDWNTSIVANKMIKADDNHYYLVVQGCDLTASDVNNYSFKIVPYREDNSWESPQYPGSGVGDNYGFRISDNGTYTLIYTIDFSNDSPSLKVVPVKDLTLSNNISEANATWNTDNQSYHFSYVEGTTWSIDVNSANVSGDWEFRIWTNGILGWDGWHNIAASSQGESLAIGSTVDASYASDDTNNSWKVSYPSYSFKKYTISIEYDVINYKWIVSADAYISPLLSKEYGTFSVAAPLDFSKATGLTAYYASAVNGSTVTMTKLDGAVAENTGLLLKKAEGDISIPVAATGTDLSSSNSLKYGTGGNVSSDNNYNRYVLATQSGVQNFYKLSTTGNIVPEGKAYLEIPATNSAPSLSIDIDGETTGIEVINAEISETGTANGQAFDLSGRRIAEPTKGVYIMNGKKMIVK